jgi:hypothetical protein
MARLLLTACLALAVLVQLLPDQSDDGTFDDNSWMLSPASPRMSMVTAVEIFPAHTARPSARWLIFVYSGRGPPRAPTNQQHIYRPSVLPTLRPLVFTDEVRRPATILSALGPWLQFSLARVPTLTPTFHSDLNRHLLLGGVARTRFSGG